MEVGIDSVSAADRPGLTLGCNHAVITHDYVSWLLSDIRLRFGLRLLCVMLKSASKFFLLLIPGAAS